MIQLPESLENRMRLMLGSAYQSFSSSLSDPPNHSIRINKRKWQLDANSCSVEWCSTGFYLKKRPIYTLDPLFHAGSYYVQESSSMFLEQFIHQAGKKKLRVLDLCAAPGGKSTHLSTLLTEDSLLVSNEVIHSRAMILSENLKKWGHPNTIVTCNDPRDFSRLPGFFDIVVIDAPCSGEGLFRRDPTAMDEWSDASTDHCAQRQKRIMADVWPALAEDGMLIYSTCTFNPAENEENISWLQGFSPVEAVHLNIPEEWGIVTTDANGFPCYRFYPHKVKGEGLFTAAVRKKQSVASSKSIKSRNALVPVPKSELKLLEGTIGDLSLLLLKFEDRMLGWPLALLSELDQVKATLRIIHAGVTIGEIKRDQLIPSHDLAISTVVNKSNFPLVELTLEEAILYLKRADFQLVFEERGWNLVTYCNRPLGWAKNIGTRFNNGYPKEWRIRMSTTEYTGERLVEAAAKFPLKSYE